MFGFGGLSEVFFILVLALLIFGPEKLPEIGRMLAKGMAEVRKASNELKRTLNAELAASEQEQTARRNLQAVPAPAASSAESFQVPELAPTMPPRWPAASTIPAIEPFPAAPPVAPPAAASELPVEPGVGTDSAAAAPEPLLAPYGEGHEFDRRDGEAAPAAGTADGAEVAAADAAHGAGTAQGAEAADAVHAAGAADVAEPADAPHNGGTAQGAEVAEAADAVHAASAAQGAEVAAVAHAAVTPEPR
jgi:TatA/E family protein of Tat protein translocase